MVDTTQMDQRFGDVAVNLNMVTREKFDRALVLQNLIQTRTKVHLPIGRVLKEMGILNDEQIDEILETQRYISQEQDGNGDGAEKEDRAAGKMDLGLELTLSDDRLHAFLSPTGANTNGLTVETLKEFLADGNVVFGLLPDEELGAYLSRNPLPVEPFEVACGIPMVPGRPSQVIYHFDTDPMRIGTLKEDGTMDWKNRGDIPSVKEGDLLAEKTGGDPGEPGTDVCGRNLTPPRLRQPKLKCGKGAARSEDGDQVLAKINGTPKIGPDGKIMVHGILEFDVDIGVETGNLEFEGFVETSGGVQAGYTVKAQGLRTTDIQDATIELEEDLICDGGIYGSHLKVGGNIQASHIHNCTIEVIGDLVVKKELYDSTVETNSRCLIGDGKIMSSTIDAKKGIYSRQIGSEASYPSKLTVGIDRKHERDTNATREELEDLEGKLQEVSAAGTKLKVRAEELAADLGKLAREQESYQAQMRQFEEQIRGEGPNAVKDDEERTMLEDMIAELVEKNDAIDARVAALLEEEDRTRRQTDEVDKSIQFLAGRIDGCRERISLLDEALEVDPGIPVIKVSGTIHAKTEIIGPHKTMILPERMEMVRIAESADDPAGKKFQFKISTLR